ncbi:hypothetical protein V5O48_017353 [Marasmius crinis-equi]|uniref:Carboxylic ester hydrolase n=1 Tax=Marasmius crinis-equi TaxID=585013 RepID=A0ABR3EPF4_9AGAR
MEVETSPTSKIYMEAWLPKSWTGRFLSTGNGGLGGCIQYPDLVYTTSLGFATVGANNGHNGTSGAAFENHPQVLADFAFRSEPYKKSYFFGCSTGGRQGLKSTEDFPEDFDGVVAGAPAANYIGLITWSGNFFTGITKNSSQATFILITLWTGLIHDSILSQCDTIDGVNDGIIEDPNTCNYEPSVLLCRDDSTSHCLTETQVETVRKVFSPFLASDGETILYPPAQPGSEGLLLIQKVGGQLFQITSDWFRYVVYNSSFDPTALALADYESAIRMNPFDIATFKGDLVKFRARGGKLLTYHGQVDGLISPRMSEVYYSHAKDVSGSLDDFYSCFRISGMSHCSGGPGAWQIGQSSAAGTSIDPDKNVLAAMVQWVEHGLAPETIEGVKFENDDVGEGVAFRRKHCRFPLRNTYDRRGDPTLPESWSCQEV